MVSVIKKLRVLMWKCFLLRRRNWLLTTFELISPVLIIYLTRVVLSFIVGLTDNLGNETPKFSFGPENLFQLYVGANIAYTPNNSFTDKIMKNTLKSIEIHQGRYWSNPTIACAAMQNEDELLKWLKNQTLSVGPASFNTTATVGIVFVTTDITSKVFRYKIRTNSLDMLTEVTKDKGSTTGSSTYTYMMSGFLCVQLCLDNELMKNIIGETFKDSKSAIKAYMPLPDLLEMVFLAMYIFMIFAYVFLVASAVRDVIQEKASGIKELMKIMGVSTWMIWTHWLMYILIVHIPVTIVITIILAVLRPVIFEVNVFILWLLFFLFTLNCIMILFVASCLFNGPILATTICAMGWLILHFFLISYVQHPSQFTFFQQILLCTVPLNNLVWALHSMVSFKNLGLTWTLGSLFTIGSTGSRISVGGSIIIFLLESLVLTVVLAYLDAIMPGPYGVAKPVYFCCQWFKCSDGTSRPTPASQPPASRQFTRPSTNVRPFPPDNFELPPKEAKVGIEIRGLQKRYGIFRKKVVAVENVDLDIYKGEIMALLGHNGAGKTTVMSMITGMFSPTKGTILYDGKDINSAQMSYRESLGLCTQHNLYFPKFTVLEHLKFFGMLKGLSYSEARANGIELLELLDIAQKKNSKVGKLSGGMIRRLCLSVALIGNPKVLILDEPTSGLDPENRRKIWNIILSLRGQRTILITTHFMEEADVLGDRIAIMDHGQVVCCGTTTYLKKLYGTGYHIHILKGTNSSTKDIADLVQQNVPMMQTKIVSPGQVDFVVKEDFVENFPSLFTALEKNKTSLGINSISVTSTTMEDVFLKVAEKILNADEQGQDHKTVSDESSLDTDIEKAIDFDLLFQRILALLWKRTIYRKRNVIFLIIKLFISSAIIYFMCQATFIGQNQLEIQPPLKISLELYQGSNDPILYDDDGKRIADIAMNVIRKQKSEVTVLPDETNIENYLIELSRKDYYKFSKALLVLQFLRHEVSIQYLEESHLSAISVNLLTNIMLQNYTNDSSRSIEVINHPFVMPKKEGCDDEDLATKGVLAPFTWMSYFFLALLIFMIDFIPFIVEEKATGFKHQQLLTGVSPLLYWAVNFIFDYCLYIICVVVYLFVIIILWSDIVLDFDLMGILVLVLLLFGISELFFIYFFSYWITSKVLGVSIFLLGNVLFCLVPSFAVILSEFVGENYLIYYYILSLNPLFAASMSIYKIAFGITNYNVCKSCHITKNCEKHLISTETIWNMPLEGGILLYILYLSLSWALFFSGIMFMDCGLFREICLTLFYKKSDSLGLQSNDEDLRKEREYAQLVKESDNIDTPLLVESLSKTYCFGPTAARCVSFVVRPGECFGLLGVNGAGKTTIFKILTGEIYPNHGDAQILHYSVIRNRRKYQNNIGYCPQFDALLEILTGEEILKIIAQLRGIPRNEVSDEVTNWLEMLGISEHGKKQSGKYSGGTKRKLSTGMAFIGDPVVVFLDEPTTGVDPMSRRKLWSVVQSRQKAGQSIVLTSHSMEECEALCDRLTIMKAGEMMCIGTSEYLKKKFSQGYTVLVKLINPTEREVNRLKEEFDNTFPRSLIKDEHTTMILYQIQDRRVPLSTLFREMLRLKSKHSVVEDFSVSNTTLEQLFMYMADK